MRGFPWSESDVKLMREWYPTRVSIQTLCLLFDRSRQGVKERARKLGLRRQGYSPRKLWPDSDVELLKEWYPTKAPHNTLSLLFGRPWTLVAAKAKSMGLKRLAFLDWTVEEIALLQKTAGKLTSTELALLLRRPPWTVVAKAIRLGISLRRNPWTQEEDALLQNNFSKLPWQDLVSLFPKRSRVSIAARAYDLGLHRPKTLTPDLRELWRLKAIQQYARDPFAKQRFVERTNTPEARRKNHESHKRYYASPEAKQKKAEVIKRLWGNPVFAEKMKELSRGRWKDPLYRNRVISLLKGNLTARLRALATRARGSIPQKIAFETIRNLLPQYEVKLNDWSLLDGRYEIDITIPKLKTAIEWDGIYFHSLPCARQRDEIKTRLLKEKGWRLIRISDPGYKPEEIRTIVTQTIRQLGDYWYRPVEEQPEKTTSPNTAIRRS